MFPKNNKYLVLRMGQKEVTCEDVLESMVRPGLNAGAHLHAPRLARSAFAMPHMPHASPRCCVCRRPHSPRSALAGTRRSGPDADP